MTTLALTDTARAPSSRSVPKIFGLELRNELLKNLRMPAYAIPTMAFPCAFYLMFGVVMPTGKMGGDGMSTYLLASYGVFAVLGAALHAMGIGLAVERGQGWLLAKRAMPMPVWIHLGARLGVAVALGAASVLGLMALGGFMAGVRLELWQWTTLLLVLAASCLPFGAIGLAFGYLLGPNSAPAVINLIYLPVSFLSGLWLPIALLPGWLQRLAEWLPPFHANRLALRVIEMGDEGPLLPSIVFLVLTTGVAFAVAVFAYKRDQGRQWG